MKEIAITILVGLIVYSQYMLNKNPYWPGYGTIKIVSDTKDGYSSFSTHQEFPMEYILNTKEYKSGEYQLLIQ